MKRLLLPLFLFAGIVLAQNTLDPNNTSTSASGSISVNGTDCTNSNACVWIVAPANGTSAAIQLSGTFTATLQFEKSVAGSSWVAATSTNNATSATSAGIYSFTVVGARFLRVRASAYSAGPVVVNITATVSGGSGGGSGSGASLPATTNLIKGDGLGNGADSGISVDGSGNVAISAIVPVTISALGALRSGTYTSGITATGSTSQTCTLTFSDGATATVALTGTNTIAGSTALASIVAGTGLASPPTTATVSNGTATCSGTPVLATVTSVTPGGSSGFWMNNTSGTLTYVLPTITSGLVGLQQCFRNAVTKTGAITLTAPASTYFDVSGAVGTVAGTLVSGGALGDAACVVAIDTTHYYAYVGAGSWTNN